MDSFFTFKKKCPVHMYHYTRLAQKKWRTGDPRPDGDLYW